MSALWTGVGVTLVAAVFGCMADQRAGGDARVVSDVTDPAAQDDAANEASDTPESLGLLTVPSGPTYSPAAAGLCAGAPAEIGDSAAWVDARALWLAPRASAGDSTPIPIDRFESGEVPRSPVSLIANSADAPALVVAVADAASCELRIFDRQGGRLGAYTVATPQCTNPSGVGALPAVAGRGRGGCGPGRLGSQRQYRHAGAGRRARRSAHTHFIGIGAAWPRSWCLAAARRCA